MLTPDSIGSEVCGKEIAHAAANNKRLVPIVHRDIAADRVPKSLGELNWIFFRDSDDFEEATDTLIRWIRISSGCARTRVCSPEQLSGTQTGGTTALFCGVKICDQQSDGWRKLAPKKNGSPPRFKLNTSSQAAKPLRDASGSHSGP